jgi:hypothetical protein
MDGLRRSGTSPITSAPRPPGRACPVGLTVCRPPGRSRRRSLALGRGSARVVQSWLAGDELRHLPRLRDGRSSVTLRFDAARAPSCGRVPRASSQASPHVHQRMSAVLRSAFASPIKSHRRARTSPHLSDAAVQAVSLPLLHRGTRFVSIPSLQPAVDVPCHFRLVRSSRSGGAAACGGVGRDALLVRGAHVDSRRQAVPPSDDSSGRCRLQETVEELVAQPVSTPARLKAVAPTGPRECGGTVCAAGI